MYSGRGKKFNKKNRRFNKGNKFQNRTFHPKKEYRHKDQLTEADAGITEFISDLEGFSGIIKARYSDFHVNEINLEGMIAKLSDTSIPKDFVSKAEKLDYKEVPKSPLKHLPQEKWEAIKNLLNSETEDNVNLEADSLSKDDRTQVHECIKSHFGQKIVASTVMIEEKKYMQFKKFNKEEKNTRVQWPKDKGEYVYFLVYKEAQDTMDACFKISDCLKMSPANFTYAGVKDKRAKTTQWFCVRKVEPWKILTRTRPLRNIKIGNFSFKDVPLKLGQLQGNQFRIALRNVTGSDELINQTMTQVRENGFINFYGLQRFGNDKEVPTYKIGINLLLGKWKEAAQLILKPKTSDDPFEDISKAKKIYCDTGSAEKAYEVLARNKNRCVEARLLEGLKKGNDNDYVNAFENIPRNMRLLYIHSFQSLIWNKMVSKRIQLYGMKPVEEDFVLVKTNEECLESTSDILNDEKEDDSFKCRQEVKALTAAELSDYTIYDVVLPLPGYDINYPENLKDYYREALKEYGLTLEMTKQKVKTYTLCGNYRKILEKAKDVSWKIMHYNDPTDNLIRSDFDELRGNPEPKDTESGRYKALVMEFSLPSSCYATMVLREILKTDTSSSAQARLNDYHETKEQKKIIVDPQISECEKTSEACEDIPQSSSLLANSEKYAEFKNNIFKSTEQPVKRKNDESDDENKKIKVPKIEEIVEHTGIKMEASLV